jgi:hypothetical protein
MDITKNSVFESRNSIKQPGRILLLLLPVVCILASCNKNGETDTIYPQIDLSVSEAFPVQCSVIETGKTFRFKARFTDNVALGSFSLDIHHNFDHHTHSTDIGNCDDEPVKLPENPMLFIQDYTIPEGSSDYTATADIAVPENIDTGDYHFLIRLTDREGWQTIKGISIKIK